MEPDFETLLDQRGLTVDARMPLAELLRAIKILSPLRFAGLLYPIDIEDFRWLLGLAYRLAP
jgi:hypothetical protein